MYKLTILLYIQESPVDQIAHLGYVREFNLGGKGREEKCL